MAVEEVDSLAYLAASYGQTGDEFTLSRMRSLVENMKG